MSQGPQYTSCVAPADFSEPNPVLIAALATLIVAGIATALASFGIGALVAIAALVQLLRYVLNFMLNGKLICLHRKPTNDCHCGGGGTTVCAIGEVADAEEVGEDKNPIADVDNDYAINLVLAPFNMQQFAANWSDPKVKEKNHALATAATQPQGDLLARQDDMPKFDGYNRTMIRTEVDGKYHAWTEIVGRDYGWFGITGPDQQQKWADYVLANAWLLPRKFPVPVLHCEFEGSRIRDMLDAINAFSFGGSWCKKNWFFGALCTILQTLFAPLALAAVLAAWAAADDGNLADALQGGGTITNKDWVIVRGRWAYDGGHDGYNEVHATRIIQKVYNVPPDPTAFKKFLTDWCDRMSEVPHVEVPGVRPLDAPAGATFDNQQKPENGWTLHPDVDGCAPEAEEDDEPLIIK